ncbi:hypothetical protein K1719_027145 [Acacia pycnantha]|nr:hypothetical protein K1719_027145 [Acacia pycnantha]
MVCPLQCLSTLTSLNSAESVFTVPPLDLSYVTVKVAVITVTFSPYYIKSPNFSPGFPQFSSSSLKLDLTRVAFSLLPDFVLRLCR